jgi:hypothetical protein
MSATWSKYRVEIADARQKATRYDPQKVHEKNDGRLYYEVELKGKTELINFGNQWEGWTVWKDGRLTKRQKRMFNQLATGLQCGISKKERLIFMTLTTKYDKNDPNQTKAYKRKFNNAFTILKKRIETYLRRESYIQYCKKHHLTPFQNTFRHKASVKYPQIWAECKFCFKYFKVRTSEGGGVFHIVFRKGYNVPKLPQAWVSQQWAEIWHGSWNVNLEQIKYDDSVKTSFYIIRGYIQTQPVIRVSYGHQWVYQGFRRSFIHLIEVYGFKRGLEIWKKKMSNNDLPTPAGTYQSRFRYRKRQNKTYNKRFFNLEGYSPAKLDIAERHIKTRYPESCYQWNYDGEETLKLQGGKLTKVYPQKVKGRLLRLPTGKINLSRANYAVPTVQSSFNTRCISSRVHYEGGTFTHLGYEYALYCGKQKISSNRGHFE